MQALARVSAHRPRLVLFVAALLAVAAIIGAGRVRKEDDLLVFLPTRDPDVQRFEAVSKRFGSMRVALVGVEVTGEHDVFEAEVLGKIGRASEAIKNLTGVDRVVSLTTMTDVLGSASGAEVTPLVAGPPADEAAHAALRAKVLSRDHVVGTAVSADGRAALLLVFLADAHGGDAAGDPVEQRIRAAAERELTGLTIVFGGAPFAGRAIYDEAQADVWRLSPIALLLLLLVVTLVFRDPVAVALTLLSVGYAALLVVGAMGFIGERWTVATATLPVILFASGSSYAVHVLGRYFLVKAERPESGAATAMDSAISIVAAPLAIAAASTSVGFFSFVATDVRPMRAFGVACGTGVLLCWLTSLTLVPAVVSFFPRRTVKPLQIAWLGEGVVRLWRLCERHRIIVLGGLFLLGAALLVPSTRVHVRMEPRLFFRKGSDPERAERFLVQRFGGATFVQVAVDGDFDEPVALRELAQLEDRARTLRGVTQVQSIVAPLVLVSDAMGTGHRLPTTRGQATNLYFFLQGQPEVRSLLSEDRKHALIHVRVAAHAEAVVDALEAYVKERFAQPRAWPTRDAIAAQLADILTIPGQPPPDLGALQRAARVVAEPTENDPALVTRKTRLLRELLRRGDAPKLREGTKAEAELAVEQQKLGWEDTWRKAAVQPDDVELALANLSSDFDELRLQMGVDRAYDVLIEGSAVHDASPAVQERARRAVSDLFVRDAAERSAAVTLHADVAGEPVLDRGFSAAVERNHQRSTGISIVVVSLFMLALFRNVRAAVLSMAPALLTLLILMGVMGLWGAHIDLGTSLVAGIATGAGSDFAMHYLWYLRTEDQERVSRTVIPVAILSVAIVAVGFFVLALGRSPVMHLFGGLAGAAMALSALLACFILPATWKSSEGRNRPT